MKKVYFDNAATTSMLDEVVEVMVSSMRDNYGNPSSTHQLGRKAKVQLETSRKSIAKKLNVSSSEIFFTSGGTEGNNLVLRNAVENLGVKKIITSKIEHHAVLDVVIALQETNDFKLEYVNLDELGRVDLLDLEYKLANAKVKSLVSLMWVNNEIGNVLEIKKVGEICRKNNTLFHTDAVQAVGHFPIDMEKLSIDFLVASAHKFHGPKGVGFLYANTAHTLLPMFYGGGQEKGKRSGTENVVSVLGMEKALDIAVKNLEDDKKQMMRVKSYFINKLKENFNGVSFNGCSGIATESSCAILNVRFPVDNKLMLFNLDLNGVFASAGSACQSGASKKSHVLQGILNEENMSKTSIRFSFSKFSTFEEVDFVVEKLKKVI